jgi:hypothetical protein
LGDPVVDSHEVGVLGELGDDLPRAHPLSLTCYRSDRHEALLWGGVHPALDLVECFREVPDGEGLAETSALFVTLSVALVSSVPVGVGLVGERVEVRVVAGDGVGVRVVLGYDLLAGPTRGGSLHVGPAGVARAMCVALMEWGGRTQWLGSRLAYDSPRGRRV